MTVDHTERAALARFEALLDAYGAEPRRWPPDRRAAAEALLARSPAAHALHAAAVRLDGLIDTARPEPAPAYLVGRVIASAPKGGTSRTSWFAGLLRPAAGLAFAAVLGLALGGVISPFGAGNGDVADADTMSFAIGDVAEVEL